MTQYLFSVHHDYSKPLHDNEDDVQAMFAAVGAFNKKAMDAGEFVFAGGVEEPASATVVDGMHGDAVMTDGPYLEAKEHIGGFWVFEYPDLDVALARAAEASAACGGRVEVRPFHSV